MIVINPLVQNQPTFGVMVWGLNEIGRQIVEQYPMPERTPALVATVWAGGLNKGRIMMMRPRRPSPPLSRAVISEEGVSEKGDEAPVTAIEHRVQADEGNTPCIEDPKLVVHYRFQRQRLVPGQVFTAFLTANTFCSDHEDDERDVSMTAISLGNHVRIRLDGMASTFANRLTWKMTRLAVRTIWNSIVMGFRYSGGGFVDGPRWESLTFSLQYDGVKVGVGYLDTTGSPHASA
ncbi:MAG: hypothetical protein Q9186_001889 [Xanthomendoza sp. 1 TL-2023]